MTIKLIKPYCRNPIIFQSKNLDKIKSFLTEHKAKSWVIDQVLKLALKRKTIKIEIKITRSKEIGDMISYPTH